MLGYQTQGFEELGFLGPSHELLGFQQESPQGRSASRLKERR